jgi:molybdate transport system substrate-binding protein
VPSAARRTVRTPLLVAALAALAVPTLGGCGPGGGGGGDARDGGRTVTVLAASSLRHVFKDVGAAYEKKHRDVELRFSFAGSQQLASQVRQGQPADVLATADTATMDGLRSETRGKPVRFARNRLTIATAPHNPEHVRGLKDLSRKDLKVALAAKKVPVGRYGRQALDRQHVTVRPVSQESDVASVLSKVQLGEADAGLVYVTDAASAGGRVGTVPVPDSQNAVADYPAAPLEHSGHPKQAARFISYLKSATAQKLLRKAGFQKP